MKKKEKKKRTRWGGIAPCICERKGMVSRKRGQHSPLTFMSERGSLHTCEGKGAVSGEIKRKEKGQTGKQKEAVGGRGHHVIKGRAGAGGDPHVHVREGVRSANEKEKTRTSWFWLWCRASRS